MAPHSSTLAWKIPWMEEPGRLQCMGSLESDTTEAQRKRCRDPRCSPRGNPVCRGILGVAGRLSGTVSPFRAEQGTSLETPSRESASSCQEVGTTSFFSSCGAILELRRGSQPSPWVGPGKPNLPLGLRGKAGASLESLQGRRCHLFLISSASVRSIPFLSFIEPIFA